MGRHRCVLITCIAALLLTCCSHASVAVAQRPSRVPASSLIPSPKSVLGFTPGDDRTVADWSQITDYFARLDKASDRVLIRTIGETTRKRPIIVAEISARENILALDKYKEIQRRLSDPRLVTTELERDRLIQNGK